MNTLEHDLLTALRTLEAAARASRQPGATTDFQALFARIDELAGRLPPETDPELRHFLARKSYGKAREYLEGRAVARGSCGG